MNGTDLAALVADAVRRLAASADELRDLDAAVGDGDLGITITKGAGAVAAAMQSLAPNVTPSEVVLAGAEAFGNANPSTFASLVSSGLRQGAKATAGILDLSVSDIVELGRASADTIARRGKSSLGDKTVLDALVPSLDAAAAHPQSGSEALAAAIAAAATGISDVTGSAARKGRASWAGERGVGVPDAGATAYLRFLEALR